MSTVTIDRAGRIVIPKRLRDRLRLEPGDTVELEEAGDQINLRPIRATSPLVKEEGVWVYRSGAPVSATSIQDLIEADRAERAAHILGL